METIATEAPVWGQLLLLVPLGVVLAVGAATDLRDRKIYNWLTYPMVVVGLILHTIVFGLAGLGAGLVGAGIVLGIGLIILPFGWLGGGDIKLLAAVGATLGPGALFEIFFYSVVVGFVAGVVLSLVNGYLWQLLARIGRYLKWLVLSATTRTNLTTDLEPDDRAYLPFAVPVLLGAVLATTDAYLDWPLLLEWIREAMRAAVQR